IVKLEFRHIKPITFTSDQTGPHLLIIAGVHGDEYEPILAVQDLVERLKQSHNLVQGKLTLVPVANIAANHLNARTGPDGLDLARACAGKEQGSLTEQVAREISTLIESVDYLIDMHTGGRMYEIYPLSGYMLHPDTEVLASQRTMARAFG